MKKLYYKTQSIGIRIIHIIGVVIVIGVAIVVLVVIEAYTRIFHIWTDIFLNIVVMAGVLAAGSEVLFIYSAAILYDKQHISIPVHKVFPFSGSCSFRAAVIGIFGFYIVKAIRSDPIIYATVFIAVFVLGLLLLALSLQFMIRYPRLPPGPAWIPIRGSTETVPPDRSAEVCLFCLRMEQYGEVSSLWQGRYCFVYLNSSDAVEEAFVSSSNSSKFEARPLNSSITRLLPKFGLFYGSDCRRLREIAINVLKKQELSTRGVELSVHHGMTKLLKEVGPLENVDPREFIACFTFRVIGTAIVGSYALAETTDQVINTNPQTCQRNCANVMPPQVRRRQGQGRL